MREVRWFHWVSLSACTAVMLIVGALEAVGGADPSSRFYAIDTIVVRVLGVALVACAFWLPLRQDTAFVASMWILGAHVFENLATYRFEAASAGDIAATLATIAVVLVLPLLALADLRAVFRAAGSARRE